MSLLYDSWLIPLLSMNQDAFLYNTLAHDTTTPHGYQRAANVGTKSHQHKIKHGNRRNKYPWKSLKWVDMNRVKYPAAWISFGLHSLLCCLRFKDPSVPWAFMQRNALMTRALAAQRSGSGSSETCCASGMMPKVLTIQRSFNPFKTWGRHSLEVSSDPIFSSKFCQLEAAIWSVFGSELPTLLYDLLFAPCSRSAPETPSWSRSQFLKRKQTHFPIRKHWWKLVLLVCLAKTSEMIGDSCTFQKHKTSHQFYRWQIKTTLCNRFPKDCLLETHLKIEKTHHSSKLLNIIQSITQPQANLHAIDARPFLMVSASKVSRISHDRWKSCVWM